MHTRIEKGIVTEIAYQCAPVCVGIKPSNLLNIEKQNAAELYNALEKTGLNALYLYEDKNRLIILLYRENLLKQHLRMTDVILFLRYYGYNNDFLDTLRKLREKFALYYQLKKDFPHEIGAFLGYPISDVKKFIKYKGKDSLITGYWKVYDNPESARTVSAQYNYVRKETMKAIVQGTLLCEINKVVNITKLDKY